MVSSCSIQNVDLFVSSLLKSRWLYNFYLYWINTLINIVQNWRTSLCLPSPYKIWKLVISFLPTKILGEDRLSMVGWREDRYSLTYWDSSSLNQRLVTGPGSEGNENPVRMGRGLELIWNLLLKFNFSFPPSNQFTVVIRF